MPKQNLEWPQKSPFTEWRRLIMRYHRRLIMRYHWMNRPYWSDGPSKSSATSMTPGWSVFYGKIYWGVNSLVRRTTEQVWPCKIKDFNQLKFLWKWGYLLAIYQQIFLSDLKNQTIVSSCVTHILPSCGYFKGQEQICFNPTSWHLVTYNFLRGHKFWSIIRSMTTPTFLA